MDSSTALAYSFVQRFNEVILFPTIALLSAVAILVFMYGCFLYIVRAGDPAARAQGIKHITWGIVGVVVMLSAYTIMSIAAGTFGLNDELDRANEGQIVNPPNPVRGGVDTANTGNRGTADDGSAQRGNAE
jgi:hypothetical protein